MVHPEKIHSLKDLELEKQRLRLEIYKSESQIHSSYHHLLHSLSFRNIASAVVGEIATTSSVFSKAMNIGQAFFGKRKKKNKVKEPGIEPVS
jgi:hypothetical protein